MIGPAQWQTVCQIAIAFGGIIVIFGTYGNYHFGKLLDNQESMDGESVKIEEMKSIGPTQNNFYSPGSNQTNYFITKKPPRTLGENDANELVKILTRDKKIKILVINGDTEAHQYALQIRTFLESKGWAIDPNFYSYMMPAIGLDKRENADHTTLIVGSAS